MDETPVLTTTPSEGLQALVSDVMSIESVSQMQGDAPGMLFRGRLTTDSESAYDRLAPGFEDLGKTLLLRREGTTDIVVAIPRLPTPGAPNPLVNLVLFVLTLLSVGYTGLITGASYLQPGAGSPSDLDLAAPGAILLGAAFTATFLGILLAHEFGHYLAARGHGARVSLPYFIPFPGTLLGTMGAAIRMLAPPRNRKTLLDIGMAGPLAGLAVAVPLLLIGLSLSQVGNLPATSAEFSGISLEGNSIFYLAAKYLVKGELLPAPADLGGVPPLVYWARYLLLGVPTPIGGRDVLLHPVAWAGWAGLMITAFNLIPVGQLDGGHAVYVLLGNRARAFYPFVVGGLLLMGFVWAGWWLWAVLALLLGRAYAQPLDDVTPLDPRRRWVAGLGLVLFFLLFIPVPLRFFGAG
ncbi:MAG TPA: site-2 protease family protein [Anaerolineales bacterium]|nr:site-2 protease family protein [Anaerolineales bacterium]